MANEILRKIKYLGIGTGKTREHEHSMHWNADEQCFEIWTEGDVCADDGEYSYAVFEFDLTRDEAFKLYNGLGQWLKEQDGSSEVV